MEISQSKLPSISPGQWDRLTAFFAKPCEAVLPHEVCVATSIDRQQAVALFHLIAATVPARLSLLVYHSCNNYEVPIGLRPFEDGPIGYHEELEACPDCGEISDEKDAFRYEVCLATQTQIRFAK